MKRFFDISCACFLVLLFSPLLILIAILIKLESSGSVFFKQVRVGQAFRPFHQYKFRTFVYDNSLEISSPDSEKPDFYSFTRIGQMLRQLKLDELPQLFNVLKGEMSLVGPRPELPYYVNKFRDEYQEILKVRPGLMDLTSLTYPGGFFDKEKNKTSTSETEYISESLPEKIRLAKLYLEHNSFLFDVTVIGQTFLNLFGLRSLLLKMRPSHSSVAIEIAPDSSVRNFLLRHRRILVVIFDLFLIAMANYVAFWLRFDGQIPHDTFKIFTDMLPWLVVIRGLSFVLFSLNEGLWRYVSIWDVKKIVAGVIAGTIVFYGTTAWVLGITGYPRSIFIIDSIVLIGFLVGMRIAVRLFRERKVLNRMKRVLIIGAGDAGAKIVREMQADPSCTYSPIGFIDDDQNKMGKRIHGVKVLGTRDALKAILDIVIPEEVLVALPAASPTIIREITTALEPFKLPIKTLPKLDDILDGKVAINQIRPLVIEDLLQRPSVGLSLEPVSRLIKGKRVLVTGAGGSIGSELCRQIIGFNPDSLVLYERHENSLYAIGSELADNGQDHRVYSILGDITDTHRLDWTMSEYFPDIIFHAAAHKHVPLMELNPGEAFKNNVLGTQLVAEAAVRYEVEQFVLISTDKAVNPSSVMGATKRGAELVVQAMAKQNHTRFLTVRFGNVLGSNGSVVPRFQRQIKAGGPVTVTHPEVRRYFMSIPEAVGLVLQAATLGEQGAIYLLEMGEQIKLVDLAKNLIRLSGHLPDEVPIQFVGLRPGEKLQEELVGFGEEAQPSSFEKILKINPEISLDTSFLQKVKEVVKNNSFSSPQLLLTQMQQLIPTFISLETQYLQGPSNGHHAQTEIVPSRPKRILLVDDDPKVRDAMRTLLEARGYTCEDAEHGGVALEWLETQHADLVITDNKMPVLGGFEFLECLKQKNKSSLPPVMVLSGNLGNEDKENALKAGACAVFDKPGQFNEILPVIDRILKDA